MKLYGALTVLLPLLLLIGREPGPTGPAGSPRPARSDEAEVVRGRAPVDAFHPDRETRVTPAYGGTVIVHLRGLPQGVNYMVENASYARWLLYEMHETLVQRDWETWDWEPVLATHWDTEDTLVTTSGERLYGNVTEAGKNWRVEPIAAGNPLTEVRELPKDEVERIERGTVYTFYLHQNVPWHDGHVFDAQDVTFSVSCYANPDVDCDSNRGYFEKLEECVAVDDRTVRFVYAEQYFNVLEVMETLHILPAHVYDLADPDNRDHDPEATAAEQARFVNENPHNTDWIGLGPYRMTHWSQDQVEAQRFEDYFDPENGGYVDTIRWRHIPNDDTGFQALINGELDFFNRISSDDYFGAATQGPEFTEDFYKGYYYTGSFVYCPWNSKLPQLADPHVRRALAHCFDFEEYRRTALNGLGKQVTGSQFYFGPAYNRDVQPFPFDLDKAEEMLAEAGWYDRDGDGVIDKDGLAFVIDYPISANNKGSLAFGQKFQENLERVGIKLNLQAMEWATLYENIKNKQFGMTGLAWSLPIENDPEQLWHSRGAADGVRGSNHASVADPYVDELIVKGQRELDDEKRWAIWRELHRYLYEEVQPYLFRHSLPRKFGMSRELRGMQTFAIDPGYSIRRWYYPAGTPGTRPTPAK